MIIYSLAIFFFRKMISFLNDFNPSGLAQRVSCFPSAYTFRYDSSSTPHLHLGTFKPPSLRSVVSLSSRADRQGPLCGNSGLTRAKLSSGQAVLSIFDGQNCNTVRSV